MTLIFLLGPNESSSDKTPHTPSWAMSPSDEPSIEWTPKEIRFALADHLERTTQGEVKGLVMDPKNQQEGERDSDYFRRLIQANNIRHFFFVFPTDGKPYGTDYEAGILDEMHATNRDPRIYIFAQEGFFQETEDHQFHRFRFPIPGGRFMYLDSLFRIAKDVQTWRDVEELGILASRVARRQVLLDDL